MRLRSLLTGGSLAALLAPLLVVVAALPAAADQVMASRVAAGDPSASAVHLSEMRYPDGSVLPRHVVLSRDDVFADSLAGAPLLGDGPLLLTRTDSLSSVTRLELVRLHDRGVRRVFVLGGPVALSAAVEEAVRGLGFDVRRLAGPTRVETSLAIADEVRSGTAGTQILLARSHGTVTNPGSGWVDSVAGGAYAADRRLPVVLTASEALDPAVAAWLRDRGITTTRLLGGPVALSDAVFDAVPGPRRHAGDERTATAAAVATQLWGAPDRGARAFTIVNGVEDRGWAFGLAASGLAADRDAPVLLAMDRVTAATRRLVATCGEPEVDLTIVGDGTLVSGAVREYLDDLDGQGCGPDRTLRRSPQLEGFPSCPALLDWFRTNALERVTAYGLDDWYGDGVAIDVLGEVSAEDAAAAPAADAPAPVAPGVSGTNNQEVGVDEADVVKTNGDIATIVRDDGSVDVVELDGSPRVLSNLPAGNEVGSTEVFLMGHVVTMLTTRGGHGSVSGDAAVAPGLPGPVTTTVSRWDLSSPASPTQLSSFEVDGRSRRARLIGGTARIVLESGPQSLAFAYPEDASDHAATVALEHNRAVVSSSTLQDWMPSWGPAGSRGDGDLVADCGDVHAPPVWSGFTAVTVLTVDVAGDGMPGPAATVMAQGETVYASTDRLLVTTSRWGEPFEAEQLDSTISTEIHAFDITAPDDVAYVGSGSVDGHVINQFALSEYDGDVRVAATTSPPWQDDGEGQRSESFVAVLRERSGALVEVGRVGGLGLGEQIQAVRFFGDLGVVVTFRQVDPLYLVDLQDGTRPVVTGELKDTGFSEYLHRPDEDHLMGVGVHADADGRQLGAMAAVYDIGDRTSPTRVARHVVPEGHTPVGEDHRSFLYWAATGDAFVPFGAYGPDGYRQYVSVLRFDGGAQLVERGRLTHPGEADGSRRVLRTFIVGDQVWSVSPDGLGSHERGSLARTAYVELS